MEVLNLIWDQSATLTASSICHWKLNSISAYNYAKRFLFKAYIAIYMSEAYLDSRTPSDDYNLEISGYILVRSDHSSTFKLLSSNNFCKI